MTDFARLVRAEWTKFRTVRGWVLGMVVAVLVIVSLGLFSAAGSHTSCGGASEVCPAVAVGPYGEAVNDKFFFVHRPLEGDGGLTVRVTSMTGRMRLPDAVPGVRNVASGVVPWAKAGLMIKDGTREGSAYAAVMVTGGHGVRMQHNFTRDVAGSPGGVSADSPRWLRLTRSGETITGYESPDGRTWTRIGTAELAGLPATVRIGLFAASPGALTVTPADLGGSITAERFAEATATFDRLGPQGEAWTYDDVAAARNPDGTVHHPGSAGQSAGTFTVTGTGDIGPRLDGPTIANTLTGVPAGLIALVVVSVLVSSTEYRRGLIHASLLAGPRRGRLPAAKAVVVGAVAFAAGLAATGVVVPVGTRILRANGNPVLAVPWLTELRVVVGMAALTAAAAVFALALGALFRRSAAAVTAAVALIIVPHILATASVLPAGVGQWLLRLTPAAGFAIQQSVPAYAHVLGDYSPSTGFYPLAPWAGLAVLCGYAVLALSAAAFRLRRRDA
ncbi:ABC transporter permease subunit [Nonomuraea typhae]|uniref:ABC transporter permease subunit n=1 Tax=Nonomuraea typhae TaxID=2603600 RepID=A0ABW7Z6W6_9ACTN